MTQNNKAILALAASLLCGGAAAQPSAESSVQLYGIIDVGVTAIDGYGDKTRRFVSSGTQLGSRLGLRGNEDLGGGWRAMFTLEHQLYADTGSQNQQTPISGFAIPARALVGVPNTIRAQLEPALGASLAASLNNRFWHRQAWAGIVTPVGAVLAGRQYSPAFATYGRFDPHQAGNIGNALATLSVPTGLEVRIDNSLQYVAEMNGFRFNAMLGAGEGEVGPGRFWGLSAGYASGGFDIGVGHQRRKTSEGLNSLENTIVGASYSTGPWKVTGVVVSAKDKHPILGAQLRAQLNANTAIPAALKPAFLAYGTQIASNLGFDGHLAYGGVHYRVTERNRVIVSYGAYSDSVAAREAAIGGVALEHLFSKRTSVWLSASYVDNKSGQQVLPYSQGLLYGFTDKPGKDASAYSLNLVHRF
ncbi:porin [Paucibacter sp. XJ19-41]|uniref:porin n=1 Tax=Paucibacter sp. XJ19-41 TaxID=2927824 RepID=UPI002349B5C3|nr:porin [Paucibacter sp. XJ19-41]MDC6169459.1 porin [Paucibacter sp. XJ19-41]